MHPVTGKHLVENINDLNDLTVDPTTGALGQPVAPLLDPFAVAGPDAIGDTGDGGDAAVMLAPTPDVAAPLSLSRLLSVTGNPGSNASLPPSGAEPAASPISAGPQATPVADTFAGVAPLGADAAPQWVTGSGIAAGSTGGDLFAGTPPAGGTATASTNDAPPAAPASTAVISSTTHAGGLVFNIGFDQADNALPVGFKSAVLAAFQFYANAFNVSATLYYNVGYGEKNGTPLGANSLGESFYYYGPTQTYDALRSALIANAKTAAAKAALNDLPASDPTVGDRTLQISVAEEKALGLTGLGALGTSFANPDGYVGFSSTNPFDYTAGETPPAGQYDFVGTVFHEIAEVMGRFPPWAITARVTPSITP